MARAPAPIVRGGVVTTAAVLLSLSVPAVTQAAGPAVTHDPAVVMAWNEIAFQTIAATKPPPVQQLYLGFVSTAVYNAVVTIDGDGRATLRQPRPRGPASPDVAAATAAHDVLVEYLPGSRTTLDSTYNAWLAGVPGGLGRDQGLQVGHTAAQTLITSRVGDGRDAPITLTRPAQPPPGTWVPTGGAEMVAPWLGFLRPVLIGSPTQFAGNGPDELTSAAYAADVREVQTMGSATSTGRTPEQTKLALFFNDNPVRQYQDAMRERATRRGLDILESARMFAAANDAGADALITCWRGKYDEHFWRPITAIRQADTDGNPATAPDPTWTPLGTTPSYPEWPSGHACLSGATARALERLFGNVDMRIGTAVAGVAGTVRPYSSATVWLDDVTEARIWLGYHFRDAMDDGRLIGRQVADTVVRNWFGS